MIPFSSTNLPASHVVLLQRYEAELHDAYAAGRYEPIIWPYHWWGFMFVVAYLLCEPSRSRVLYYYKYLSFTIFVIWSIRCVRRVRSPVPHVTYGIGLINAWAIIWLAALMIFNDIKVFRRIWATKDAPPEQSNVVEESAANGIAANASSSGLVDLKDYPQQELRQRVDSNHLSKDEDKKLKHKYYWQPCPTSFAHRVNWMFDLTTSMRAPGWQHQIRSIPTPPEDVLANLPKPHPTARPTVRNYNTRQTLLIHSVIIAAFTYLAMDVTKNVAMRDPYFWGFTDATPLRTHPLAWIRNPLLLRAYRLTLTGIMVGTALLAIFTLNALSFAGACGPDRFPYLRVRAAPWAYPNWYGSFSHVAQQGLTGWWGAFWHQIFRIGFAAPNTWLCDQLGWDQRSRQGKIAGVLIAFSLSGAIHATGSFTTFPETRPLTGSFLFFFLQGVGILFETIVKAQLGKLGILRRLPWPVKRVLVVLWVLVWMLLTAPLLVDDFAKSGVWLLEPVPFSFVRLLGYGIDGQGAWTWRGRLIWWHRGERWWQSGVAF